MAGLPARCEVAPLRAQLQGVGGGRRGGGGGGVGLARNKPEQGKVL